MTGDELKDLLADVTSRLEGQADHFRELDAAVGDGDLGVTVKAAASAARQAVGDLQNPSVSEVIRTAATAIANANPSTMAALTAGGLLRASREVGDDPVGLSGGVAAARTFFGAVSEKGKAELGDKTILDAIGPSVEALSEAEQRGETTEQALDAAIEAAQRGVGETTPLASKKGRARWVGERGKGHPDPGAVLYVRFLEAWRDAGTADRTDTP